MSLANITIAKYTRLLDKLKNQGLNNKENITKYINEQTFYSKRDYLLALCYLKDSNYDYYNTILKDMCMEDNLLRVKRPATDKEKENYIPWSDIIKIRDMRKLNRYKDRTSHMIYVLLCLYTYIPPQRGQVYYNCYIDKDVDNHNIIDCHDKKLIIREYKTKKTYGHIIIDIPDELVEILLEYKSLCIDNRVLSTITGKPMNDSSFNKTMNTIFGKNISTNMLRKIFVTEKLQDKNISITERKKIAHMMGHSISTQEFMYKKLDMGI